MRSFLHTMIVVLIILIAAPVLEAQVAKRPILVQATEMQPMTVTMLLVKLQKEFEVAIAPDKFNLSMLEALRAAGYNVVGAENVLFAVDKSSAARLLLGGTVTNLRRHRNLPANIDLFDITIRWELFDKSANQVVYKKLSRFRTSLSKNKAVADADLNKLVQGALVSLLASPRFVQAVKKGADAASSPGSTAPATFRACSAVPRSLPAEIDAVIAASATIATSGAGAGVFISPDGVLLTAEHVVSGLDEIVVKLRDGRSLPGRVLRRDAARDIAVVRVAGAPESCVPVAAAWPEVGAEVFSVGAPAGDEFAFSVSRGIVSGAPTVDGRKMIQTDASLNPGNSGGPLVDAKGRLVGVVSGKIVGREIEGMGFAVHADTALAFLGLASGDVTTLEEAGSATATDEQRVAFEDAADTVPMSPVSQVREWTAKQKEMEQKREREEYPARVSLSFGVILTVGSTFPLGVSFFLMTGMDRTAGFICLASAGVALAGGITLFAVASRLFKKLDLERKRKRQLALAFAPLESGRGGALFLVGRF